MKWLMGKTIFDQSAKSNIKTYDNIQKLTTGHIMFVSKVFIRW